MKVDPLVADAEREEHEAKHARGEDRFIVGSDRVWLAVAFDCLAEPGDQRPARFALQRLQPKGGAAGVFKDRNNEVSRSAQIGLAGEIESPDEISRNWAWRS